MLIPDKQLFQRNNSLWKSKTIYSSSMNSLTETAIMNVLTAKQCFLKA